MAGGKDRGLRPEDHLPLGGKAGGKIGGSAPEPAFPGDISGEKAGGKSPGPGKIAAEAAIFSSLSAAAVLY